MSAVFWMTSDLRALLRALNAASAATARIVDDPELDAYRRGYNEAILAVAVALDIDPGAVGLRVAGDGLAVRDKRVR